MTNTIELTLQEIDTLNLIFQEEGIAQYDKTTQAVLRNIIKKINE